MLSTITHLYEVLFVAYGIAFFFHPAIFFGLRHRLRPGIPVAAACVLSVLFGWAWLVLPIFSDGALPEAIRGQWRQEGPGAIAALMAGWVISGLLLLLWSPVLVAFAGWIERRGAAVHAPEKPASK